MGKGPTQQGAGGATEQMRPGRAQVPESAVKPGHAKQPGAIDAEGRLGSLQAPHGRNPLARQPALAVDTDPAVGAIKVGRQLKTHVHSLPVHRRLPGRAPAKYFYHSSVALRWRIVRQPRDAPDPA